MTPSARTHPSSPLPPRPEQPQPDVFYPIVLDLTWLQRLVPLGLKTIQLRLKDTGTTDRRAQIAAAISFCRDHRCQLIVNDYWREAIELGADYIHLGQEDLAGADLAQIKRAGLRLGLSTHSDEELKIALTAVPDYIALGPVYETRLKKMKWQPQGLERVGKWKAQLGALPLVAIAGITLERAPGVLQAGADSIAVITDFYTHADPEARVKQWLKWATTARS